MDTKLMSFSEMEDIIGTEKFDDILKEVCAKLAEEGRAELEQYDLHIFDYLEEIAQDKWPKADKGDPVAQYEVARHLKRMAQGYQDIDFIQVAQWNKEKSLDYFRRSANQGYFPSIEELIKTGDDIEAYYWLQIVDKHRAKLLYDPEKQTSKNQTNISFWTGFLLRNFDLLFTQEEKEAALEKVAKWQPIKESSENVRLIKAQEELLEVLEDTRKKVADGLEAFYKEIEEYSNSPEMIKMRENINREFAELFNEVWDTQK